MPKAQSSSQYLTVIDVSVTWAGPPSQLSGGGIETRTTREGEHSDAPEAPVMVQAGEAAIGYICATWYGTGRHFPLIQDILTYVYARGKGAGPGREVGTAHWIRGVLQGVLTAEALRTAMRHFGNQPLTGAQVQWGLEHLSLTAASLKELGAEGLFPPITLSCRDHEGGGGMKFQQWDGTQWRVITDWITPDQALAHPADCEGDGGGED